MDNNVKKKVDITPHVSLLPKLGFSGYKVVEAISEFIDNSIDAKLHNKKVFIQILIEEDKIIVIDDASGMNDKELVNALKLAYNENNRKRLGQFGLGLKTAATSLGKKFTIKTSKSGDDNWYIIEYDEDEWLASDKWESEMRYEKKKDPEEHGTIIFIEKPHYKFYYNLITNIKKQLSLRFASFIEADEIEIKLNTMFIESPEVDLIGDEKNKIEINLDENRKITGWYGYLKKRRGQDYGFNLYRNGRLIFASRKIGFEPHPEAALIFGELNLDFVPVTHNKREFIENSSEFKEAENAITKFIRENRVISKSREISRKESIYKIEDKIKKKLSILEKALKKEPLIEKISNIRTSEDINSELEEKSKLELIKLSQKAFYPDKLDEDNYYEFKIENDKFIVRFGLAELGESEQWVKYYVEDNEITILINADFPLYYMVKNYAYYSLILIAEAISEFIVKKYNLRKEFLINIRNMILRRAGEAQKEEEERHRMEEERKNLLSKIQEIDQKINLSTKDES